MTQLTANEAAKHWLKTQPKTKGSGAIGRMVLTINSGDDIVTNIMGTTNRDKQMKALCDALVDLQKNAKVHPSRLSIELSESKDKITVKTNNLGWGELICSIK